MTEKDKLIQDQEIEINKLKEEIERISLKAKEYEETLSRIVRIIDSLSEKILGSK